MASKAVHHGNNTMIKPQGLNRGKGYSLKKYNRDTSTCTSNYSTVIFQNVKTIKILSLIKIDERLQCQCGVALLTLCGNVQHCHWLIGPINYLFTYPVV